MTHTDSTTSEIQESPVSSEDEIRNLLVNDERRIGDVYRLSFGQGLSASEVAAQLNVATEGFVYSYRRQIEAALTGVVSNSPTIQKQVMASIRNLIKIARQERLSTDAIDLLQRNLRLVEQRAEAQEEEIREATEIEEEEQENKSIQQRLKELEYVAGIYAFSYGWYLESPVEPEDDNTLIKVGYTSNIWNRLQQHQAGAMTHMPEPLVVLRVFTAEPGRNMKDLEKTFHSLLKTAGHTNPRRTQVARKSVGQEWFLTNESFLDAIAKALGLRTELIGKSAFALDD